MFHVKNHKQLNIFDPWGYLGPKRRKLLDSSWSGLFQQKILPSLPVESLRGHYHNWNGRPTKELYSMMGVMLLQQMHDLIDDQAVEQFCFNLQWHYALNITNSSDAASYISHKSLWTMRSLMSTDETYNEMFDRALKTLAKLFKVDFNKQRMDSVHVKSNMRNLGRIGLFVKTIKKFLVNLKRQHSNFFDQLADPLTGRYLDKKEGSLFAMVKPSESGRTLDQLAEDVYLNIEWALNERLRRLFAANEAKLYGHGGITLVQKATGVARNSIKQGLKELSNKGERVVVSATRIRKVGGGRKASVKQDKKLGIALEKLVEPSTLGDPESPLRWMCKSLRQLESELRAQGFSVSHTSIGNMLKGIGYSLQGNQKTLEGSKHPDRNAQFEFINSQTEDAMRAGQPVISVDTKKKELVGQYKNGGKELRPKGKPEQVKVYDFVDKKLGKANPYGVYDIADNSAWVSVGTDHDTAAFAVSTIRRWWFSMGRNLYPEAQRLVITADGGGSNGSRVRLWKVGLRILFSNINLKKVVLMASCISDTYLTAKMKQLTTSKKPKWSSFLIVSILMIMTPNISLAFSPIARTDVVPYQRIEYGSSFNFGVVAFSKPGINRVEFAISGQGYSGGIKTSSVMSLNTRVASAEYDGVWEYYITISASEFSDNGEITITPTVYDNNSNTRVLETTSLIVEGASADFDQYEAWVDIDGSDGTGTVGDEEDPFPSIQLAITACQTSNGGSSSGNIIYLAEDTYEFSDLSADTSGGEWITITKAATADRGNVIVMGTGNGPSIGHAKYANLTFVSAGGGLWALASPGGANRIWTNACRKIGSGRHVTDSNPVKFSRLKIADGKRSFSTDDYTYDVDFAYAGGSSIIRGAVISTVGEDAIRIHRLAVNIKVDDVDNGTTEYGDKGAHSDVLQIYQNDSTSLPVANTIAYNIYATDAHYQGIMRSSLYQSPQDNAYVNVFIEMRDPPNYDTGARGTSVLSGGGSTDDHLLVWHCSFPYGQARWDGAKTNSSFVGNLFWQHLYGTVAEFESNGTDWLYNHFMYVDGITPINSCTPSARDIENGDPCPLLTSTAFDTGTDTMSTGGGVVDISTPGAADFGYPIAGSGLVDALHTVYVPVDALGNVRGSSPDIGALELSSVSGEPGNINPPVPIDFKLMFGTK